MYSNFPLFTLAFHGCDFEIGQSVLTGKTITLKPSKKSYDWLGHGIYFWEQNLLRAQQWADQKHKTKPDIIKKPFVIGAIIDLGYCLNLVDSKNIQLLKTGYSILQSTIADNTLMPQNKASNNSSDYLIRHLDCAVIETLHSYNEREGEAPFDTVRGVFWEGKPLYPNAGFKEKNHIQICVRNPNCIKGYFLPRKADSKFPQPR
jgi:hypothetical protein